MGAGASTKNESGSASPLPASLSPSKKYLDGASGGDDDDVNKSMKKQDSGNGQDTKRTMRSDSGDNDGVQVQTQTQTPSKGLFKVAVSAFSPDAISSKLLASGKKSTSAKVSWQDMRKKLSLSGKVTMRKQDIMRLGKEGYILQEWTSQVSVSKKLQRLVHTSTLRSIGAPKEAIVAHPAAWLWKDLSWSLGMDEFGNTYYYNITTGESTWDPPSELSSYQLPTAELSFQLLVPEEAIPGQAFVAQIHGSEVEVMCPLDCRPGSYLELYCPSNDVTYDYDNYENADVVDNVDEYVDNMDKVAAEVVAPAPEPVPFDPVEMWMALASLCEAQELFSSTPGLEVTTDHFLEYSQAAKDILQEVSNGSYLSRSLLQLPWAYKFTLFEGAFTARYTKYLSTGASSGDTAELLDSSDYDNCDGTPRYAQRGFYDWARDIVTQRRELVDQINAQNLLPGDDDSADSYYLYQQAMQNDYQRMQLLANVGDDSNLLSALLDRKLKVSSEIQTYQSRVLAIVCVDGGPSREALDMVYELLKDQLLQQGAGEALEKEELDEEIANHLQGRHQFMVEVVLNIVLLEEELQSLEMQIAGFVSQSSSRQPGSTSAADGPEVVVEIKEEANMGQGPSTDEIIVVGTDQEAAGGPADDVELSILRADIAAATKKVDSEALAALLLEHEESAKQLEQRLLEKKLELEKKWRERLQASKSKRLLELEASGMSQEEALVEIAKEFGVAEAAGSGSAALDNANSANGKIFEEHEEAMAELKAFEAESRVAVQDLHAQALADIRQRGEEMTKRMEDSLQAARDHGKKKLAEKLQERRSKLLAKHGITEGRGAEALSSSSLSPEELAQLSDAGFKELSELQQEYEAECDVVDQRVDGELEQRKKALLTMIKDQHEKESNRLEDELQYLKVKRNKELMQRLEKKKAERAQQLLVLHPNLEANVAVLLVEAEFADQLQSEQELVDEEVVTAAKAVEKTMAEAMRDLHDKELHRLNDEFAFKEQRTKEKLKRQLQEREQQRLRQQLQQQQQAGAQQNSKLQEEEIKAAARLAQQETDDEEKRKMQEMVQKLRQDQEQQMNKLSDDLLTKRERATKALEQRLLHQQQQQQREKDAVKAPAEDSVRAARTDNDNSGTLLLLEDYISHSKRIHLQLTHRLSLLISASKRFVATAKATSVVIQAKAAVAAAIETASSTAPPPSSPRADNVLLAQGQLVYSLLNEHMAVGFKKRCLYEVTLVKKNKSQSPPQQQHSLNITDLSEIQSPQFIFTCKVEASTKLLSRFSRDLKSTLESVESEKMTKVRSLQQAGYPLAKVIETECYLYENALVSAAEELKGFLLTLCGIWIERKLLGNVVSIGTTSPKPSPTECLEKLVDEVGAELVEDNEDDDGVLGYGGTKSGGLGDSGGKTPFLQAFCPHFQCHVEEILGLLGQYITVFWNSMSQLLNAHVDVLEAAVDGAGSSGHLGDYFHCLIVLLASAFFDQIRDCQYGSEVCL
jgi:hypothetical protein